MKYISLSATLTRQCFLKMNSVCVLIFKGTVQRDFLPPLFSLIEPAWDVTCITYALNFLVIDLKVISFYFWP